MQTRPQELINGKRENDRTAGGRRGRCPLDEVPLIGLVSSLPAQHSVKLGRFEFLMTQDGLHRHHGRALIQQRRRHNAAWYADALSPPGRSAWPPA